MILTIRRSAYPFALTVTLINPALAQVLAATPLTYDLLEGTSTQFNARRNRRSGGVVSCGWDISAVAEARVW